MGICKKLIYNKRVSVWKVSFQICFFFNFEYYKKKKILTYLELCFLLTYKQKQFLNLIWKEFLQNLISFPAILKRVWLSFMLICFLIRNFLTLVPLTHSHRGFLIGSWVRIHVGHSSYAPTTHNLMVFRALYVGRTQSWKSLR